MELIILGMLSFVISYCLQNLCIKAKRKMIKFIPLIVTLVFVIFYTALVHLAYQGELFDSGNIFEDYLGPILLQLFGVIILGTAIFGMLAAWIVYALRIKKDRKYLGYTKDD